MVEDRGSYDHQPFYCEENVLRLAERRDVASDAVLVISNAAGAVLMWEQRAARGGGPIPWDYHVVLVARGPEPLVYDLDTTLAFPEPLASYLSRSFRPVPARFRPRFRVVPAPAFRATLASDRSHMRSPGGAWLKPPPPWPAPGAGTNLLRFVDLDDRTVPGDACDLAGLPGRLVRP